MFLIAKVDGVIKGFKVDRVNKVNNDFDLT